jgi:hypothetical protein
LKQALLFLVVAAACCGQAFAQQPKPSSAPNGPRIAVEPAAFDFGPALQNKTLTKEFVVKNLGNRDLLIEDVVTTCGCTVGKLDTRTLKPGMAVPLRVSLETRSYTGALQRSVLIRSNDLANARVEVKVQAQVQLQPAPAAKPKP